MSQENDVLARLLLEFAVSLYPDQKRGWQSRFAERLGVTPQQLSDMLSGRKGIGEIQQKRLAELGMNLNWLITGKGSMYDSEKVTLRRIKVSSIQQGEPVQSSEPKYADIPESSIDGEEPLAIRVPDDSMAGVVWEGDVVFVNVGQGAANKDLCLVRIAGEGQFVRHIFLTEKEAMLIAANAPPRTLKREAVISIQRVICANVAGVHLKHK